MIYISNLLYLSVITSYMYIKAIAIGIPIAGIPGNIMGGIDCMRGINTILEPSADGSIQPDECAMAFTYVSIYMCFNVVYNLLMVNITTTTTTTTTTAFAVSCCYVFLPSPCLVVMFFCLRLVVIYQYTTITVSRGGY
jgi:hypothetical protein